MHVSPLLLQGLVEQVYTLLHEDNPKEEIILLLAPFPLEEKVHVLRFLYWHQVGDSQLILDIWRTLIAKDHPFNTAENRLALNEIGQWWNAFRDSYAMRGRSYDELENHLDALGATAEGRAYFRWVALYPVGRDKRASDGLFGMMSDEVRSSVLRNLRIAEKQNSFSHAIYWSRAFNYQEPLETTPAYQALLRLRNVAQYAIAQKKPIILHLLF